VLLFTVSLESVELTSYTTLVNLIAFRRTYARSSRPARAKLPAFEFPMSGKTPPATAFGGLGEDNRMRGREAGSTRFFLQHPLQMLLIFLSTLESSKLSLRMASSPCIAGP
jgi:hypothetical protein